MKTMGALLMLMGWLLVVTALIMLSAVPARNAFIFAGLGVEALGLTLAVRAHLPERTDR